MSYARKLRRNLKAERDRRDLPENRAPKSGIAWRRHISNPGGVGTMHATKGRVFLQGAPVAEDRSFGPGVCSKPLTLPEPAPSPFMPRQMRRRIERLMADRARAAERKATVKNRRRKARLPADGAPTRQDEAAQSNGPNQ